MNPRELTDVLKERARAVIQTELLPGGQERAGEWLIGGVSGEKGKSMRIRLDGDKAGQWIDFASGEKGNLLKLWQDVRGLSYDETLKDVRRYLGVGEPDTETKAPSKAWEQLQREMGTGTTQDLRDLADIRHLPTTDGLRAAIENGHLFFGPVCDGPENEFFHSWVITDSRRLSAQARKLSGLPYHDGQKSKTIHGTSGRWPIGIADAGTSLDISFTEGGPDFLAAYTAVAMLGLQDQIQPVTMLGSGQVIHPEALPLFKDRRIWMFPHNDENYAGLGGALNWEKQLQTVGAHVIPFDFSAYPGVKDLNDFISAVRPPLDDSPMEV